MKRKVFLLIWIFLVLFYCKLGKEYIITPNEQGDVVVKDVFNLKFTFNVFDKTLEIKNYNRTTVWIIATRYKGNTKKGILFNSFILPDGFKKVDTYFERGDKVKINVWWFDIQEVKFELPPGADIWDFIKALGGLLPIGTDEFEFTIG